MTCESCGWAAAICAMLAFGSFGVPIKSQRSISVDIDPLVFQSYKTIVCFLTCWLVLLAGVPFTFTPWGIVSGLFWVPGGTATVYAVKVAGLGIATGVGSSFIVLVSFIWGVFVFGEEVRSKVMASFAILCLMTGLYGMAYFSSPESAGNPTDHIRAPPSGSPLQPSTAIEDWRVLRISNNPVHREDDVIFKDEGTTTTSNERTARTLSSHLQSETSEAEGAASVDDNDVDEFKYHRSTTASSSSPSPSLIELYSAVETNTTALAAAAESPRYVKVCGIYLLERTAGLLATMTFTGLWGGSVLAPMKWCKTPGVPFLISFGVGASIVTISLWILRILYNTYHYQSLRRAIQTLPSFHVRIMWLPGGLSGLLWSLGNFFSLISVHSLGEGVGYPVIQTAILVSGLWGIFYFREVHGTRRISLWFTSSLLTICGILLLSYEHVHHQ